LTPDEAVGGLLIAVSAGIVLAVAVLLIIYKMIDGDIQFGVGMASIVFIIGMLLMSIKPPHPALPGIVLVVALTAMTFFPFALSTLEKLELEAHDVDRLERAYRALAQRSDNVAAQFELARCLQQQGFVHHAIAISSRALEGLSTQIDPLKNSSMKDAFRNEDYQLRSWIRQRDSQPPKSDPVRCSSCGNVNEIGQPVCVKCQRPYLLEMVRSLDLRPKLMSRLVLAWAALALFLTGAAALGTAMKGGLMYAIIGVAVLGVGFFIHWLFRKPKLSTEAA
jgi:hypothetical protein